MSEELKRIAEALEKIARRVDGGGASASDFDGGECWQWDANGVLRAIPRPPPQDMSPLLGVEEQTALLENNLRSFLRGRPSHHALLTGPRGSGKSSVARGVLSHHRKLRLIETDAGGLYLLPLLSPAVAARKEKFVLFCDDLSFGGGGGDGEIFRRLKSGLDGGLQQCENLLVVATSNRRHMLRENFSGNREKFEDDIHGGETVEENIALSDRFGLWLPFFDLDADGYENIAASWLRFYGVSPTAALLKRARVWADERGSYNARIARHFAIAAASKTLPPK